MLLLLKKWFKNFVYANTAKPDCYVHIDNPRTLQEYRQVQYNNWCKVKGVYNGSYLPKNPNKLTSEGKKGWEELTSSKDKTGKHRSFRRKSTGQFVSFHDKEFNSGEYIDEHYHWYNFNLQGVDNENQSTTQSITERYTQQRRDGLKTNKDKPYKDRYGNGCKKGSRESHLAPLDKFYDYK